jgi:cell division protein FtsW
MQKDRFQQPKKGHESMSNRRQTNQTSSARRRYASFSSEKVLRDAQPVYDGKLRGSKVSNAHIPVPEKSAGFISRASNLANPPPPPTRRDHSSAMLTTGEVEVVVSEEEQRKLRELEMRLPRVAGKIDSVLLGVILSLLCFGLVMVYSASSFVAAHAYGDASYYFQKQLLGALLGLVMMFIFVRIDYRVWRRFSLVGMAVALLLLVTVLKFGTEVYGASRWLQLGPFSFQPSEVVKLALALYIADWLACRGNRVATFWHGLAPFLLMVAVIIGLVLFEKDLGTAVIIAGLATAMFFTAGANILQFCLAMGAGGLIFLAQSFQGYRYYRVKGFLHPLDPSLLTNINLQLYQSLLGLGSGGWLGVGLGASRQKTGFLPFPFIDSIFAIIGEELGFFGGALVLLLFLVLAFRGFRLARRTQDVYGALLATGITTWLILQAMLNIGSTTASVPYTGVPLPFISYGGTSLVISLAAVGILLNISRYTREPEDPVLSRSSITGQLRRKRNTLRKGLVE